jgi:ArsR family transcriptional regulator, zinc-responsive transcriptional repressor
MEKIDYEKNSQVLKALAHPIRLKILEVLLDTKFCVTEVSNSLGIDQSVVSHHLRILKNRGVVYSQKYGSKVYYFVKNDLTKGIISIIRKN